MASINDLATAATIASSAVGALQSSPTQKSSQPAAPGDASNSNTQSSPPPPPQAEPLTPSKADVAAPPTTPGGPSGQDAAPDTPPSITVATHRHTPGRQQDQQSPQQQQQQSQPPPQSSPAASKAPDAAVPAATEQQPPQASPSAPVLAAPQISPQDAASAQIPAPPAPAASANAADAAGGAEDGDATMRDAADEDGADGAAAAEKERPKPVRGAFIVFEGMDRAGKTTQAKLLQQRCIEEGRDVKFMRFPDRTTPIGQMIDAYLKGQTEIEDHVIHLLFSANRWEALKNIQTTLAAGVSVICDRYYHSGIVYSAAKQNPTLPLGWAKAPEVGLPRPDLVLFLDLEESVARERGGWGGEVYEKGEMQRRVRELFWGLSMGDLSHTYRHQRRESASAAAAAAAAAAVKVNGGSGSAADMDTVVVGGGADHSSGAKGPSSMIHAPGGERGEFRQEEEDLQIVDADLGIEELADKVWSHVVPRLESVERGEVGDVVRVVR
ncbi:thymidylate kinase [Apiospora rasikravindrae]|uniref:dTMP kinase n=1 Tax=Apiospora rasikravindrae TaxID=990691 RepID=A0ABR1RQY8_9PEZI